MTDCISQNFKTMLLASLDKQRPHELLHLMVEDMMPTCESLGIGMPTRAAVAGVGETKRRMAEPWPAAVYIDARGEKHEKGSPSALYEELTGKRPSGSICNEEGTKCTAASLIDSFRFWGYSVEGNGESSPPTDPENPSRSLAAHQAWKDHLKSTGKKFVVIHPDWVKKQAGE